MLALVDESIRIPTPHALGLYVVGCVVLPDTEIESIRNEVIKLGSFHFRKEKKARQEMMLRQIGAWNLLPAGYSRTGWSPGGREEARQASIRRMLVDLRDWPITELVFESRTPRQDTYDSLTVSGAGHIGQGPKGIPTRWRGKEEPLLRLPDAIAGAVRMAAGKPSPHQEILKEIHTVRRTVR